ncbi:TolC family protein [Sulfurimonas sp. HSL-1716]|uniref:TolC family protein n=1 Tax=Hydrocurvibacter sulfurireducens TaxID=3131937 RepID=UPI0031F82C67
MRRIALLLIPAFIYADNLKELLDYATQKSDLVVAKTLAQEAKKKELSSQKRGYLPTLDLGGLYQRYDERNPIQPGTTYVGYAKVGLDIYDGGRRSALVDQKKSELLSSGYESEATKKSLSLQITKTFYNIKTLQASLDAKTEAQKSLKAQLYRMQQFYIAKVATKDDVDRLQAAFDTNSYNIDALKLQILSAKKQLELLVGKSVDVLQKSSFKEVNEDSYELSDDTKALIAQKDSLGYTARSVSSVYYPNIRVEDSYSLYEYDGTDGIPQSYLPPKNQNKVMVTANIRLFDFGAVSQSEEALMLNAQSLKAQIHYKTKEQKINFEIAEEGLKTSRAEIKSAKSALDAATSAFKTIEEKYNAGIVDNVTYLDALSSLTDAKALYTKALNDEQIAYATYYFYGGKNIGEYLQ